MTNQEVAHKILQTEYHYPNSYSNLQRTDYGLLFYNENNPDSNDSNHAVITTYDENTDFDGIISDIKKFYLSKNLPPMIYSDHIPGQLEQVKNSLDKYNFEYRTFDNVYLIHKNRPQINEPYSLIIKRIEKGDDLSFIYAIWPVNENRRGGADRVYKVVGQRNNMVDYNLFVGYLDDGTPVTAAATEYFDGIGLVDEVETAKAYRGNGYARQLIRYWIDYHYKNYSDRLLYLCYSNPTAGRIYREAGFVDFDWEFESWSAWID